MFEIAENQETKSGAKIVVFGIGGAGCNAVNTMIKEGLGGVTYLVANTDVQALDANQAPVKIQLGKDITKGLGAGSNPEVGKKAAMEDYDTISKALSGADMVFITAGMGGGTGTGAAPVIAKLARELGALTVGVVTKPFGFEGKKRMRQAREGLLDLASNVDSFITIPNDRLLEVAGEDLSLVDTFKKADEILLNAVKGISDLINNTGLINSDFSDVRAVMKGKGIALMGTGIASGEDRAVAASKQAIESPLLEDVRINGATGLIVNISGSSNLTTSEANKAMTFIMETADEEAEIIFGTVINEELGEEVKVTVIATGLETSQFQVTPNDINISREELAQSLGAIRNDERADVHAPSYSSHEPSRMASPHELPSGSLREAIKEVKPSESLPQAPVALAPVAEASRINTEISKDRTKSIAEKLGFINFDEDEFDTPSYLRNRN